MTEIIFPEAMLLEKCGKLHTDINLISDVAKCLIAVNNIRDLSYLNSILACRLGENDNKIYFI